MRWCLTMPLRRTADLRLCARASCGKADAALVEIEEMLAEGCICALRGDHRRRGLQRRLDALLDSLRAAHAARELQAVAREQRMVAEATRELWSQLGSCASTGSRWAGSASG